MISHETCNSLPQIEHKKIINNKYINNRNNTLNANSKCMHNQSTALSKLKVQTETKKRYINYTEQPKIYVIFQEYKHVDDFWQQLRPLGSNYVSCS